MQRHLGEALLLQVRDYRLSTQPAVSYHVHHLTVLLVLQRKLEKRLSENQKTQEKKYHSSDQSIWIRVGLYGLTMDNRVRTISRWGTDQRGHFSCPDFRILNFPFFGFPDIQPQVGSTWSCYNFSVCGIQLSSPEKKVTVTHSRLSHALRTGPDTHKHRTSVLSISNVRVLHSRSKQNSIFPAALVRYSGTSRVRIIPVSPFGNRYCYILVHRTKLFCFVEKTQDESYPPGAPPTQTPNTEQRTDTRNFEGIATSSNA